MITPRRSPPAWVAGALTALLLVGGCTGESPTGPPPPPPAQQTSATPTPSVDPRVADAEAQAVAAYNGYIQAYAVAAQAANPDDPNLARYLADPLLGRTRHSIRKLKNIGAVQIGAQRATVVRADTNLTATPPTVTIYSCLDYSGLKLVYKSSGSPVPNSAIKTTKVSGVTTVWRYKNGQWLVNDTKQGGQAC